jgi:hypothetical protein
MLRGVIPSTAYSAYNPSFRIRNELRFHILTTLLSRRTLIRSWSGSAIGVTLLSFRPIIPFLARSPILPTHVRNILERSNYSVRNAGYKARGSKPQIPSEMNLVWSTASQSHLKWMTNSKFPVLEPRSVGNVKASNKLCNLCTRVRSKAELSPSEKSYLPCAYHSMYNIAPYYT